MTAITIVGGVYHEHCVWPDWDQIYGSAGRAAAAVSGHVDNVTLLSYSSDEVNRLFAPYVQLYGFAHQPVMVDQAISFDYIHSLSVPIIFPTLSRIRKHAPINVASDVVLRFGMMEGDAIVSAKRCTYDPQSAFDPQTFSANGSKADHLAIVANRGEVLALGGGSDPIAAARSLLGGGTEVVVVKAGVEGAYVVHAAGVNRVPAYRTDRVWTVGTGDVFAAIFAVQWGVLGIDPVDAATLASRAVAEYVETMGLPIPPTASLLQSNKSEVSASLGLVYLASPFFSLGQRWVVDEARRCLREFGLKVFSPLHDVGAGPASSVAPADLAALDTCDAVFAVLDGLDAGTVFEVGHARAKGKPVYALAQTVSEQDLKMIAGSGCRVFDDFVTAIHHVTWRT